jgi:hypothetical protein
MAVLILQMLSPIVGMSKYLPILSQMAYFYNLEKPGKSGALNGILQDTLKISKLHKTGVIPGKSERIRILIVSDKKTRFQKKKHKIIHKIGGLHGAEYHTGVSCPS